MSTISTMKTPGNLFFPMLVFTFIFISCNRKPEGFERLPKVIYSAYSKTKDGDTINRMTEKGKQGRWIYAKTDGSHTDTIYINGIPQNK
jgi:hypothetical protein